VLAELDRADCRALNPLLLGRRGYPGPLIGLPERRTYVELARAAYQTPEPTIAEVSAVQRACTRLVAAGRIERSRRGAVEVRRIPTEADRKYRAEVEREVAEWKAARAEARANAIAYPVDTGSEDDGIVEVLVEPVLIIGTGGVDLREGAGE
jgi:hypothetical protein